MDMIELPPTPRVLVRVQGGEKRLAVDVVLLDFDDEIDVNGDDLFDSYCKQLLTYLCHLTTSDIDDAPTHTMALIFRYWTQCRKMAMRQNESGVRLNITNPYIPEPEHSSGIWRQLMCHDMAQVVGDFNRVQVPEFYKGIIDICNPVRWPDGWAD